MNSITVIVTCYNEGELIYQALNSLDSQSDKDFETILVNDCSEDPLTNKICDELKIKGRIQVIRNATNVGLSGARNEGIRAMRNNIVVLLDADDTLPQDAIKNIRFGFDKNPEADFLFGNYEKVQGPNPVIVDCSVLADEKYYLDPSRLASNWILLGTSPFRKEVWKKIKGYSNEFSNTCQDVDFWQRAILKNAKGKYLPEVLYTWNREDTGMNLSEAHKRSLPVCYYRNIDFTILYSPDYKEGFNLALENKDSKKIKSWARHEVKIKRNKRWLPLLLSFWPETLIPMFSSTFSVLRKFKRSGAKR